MAYGTSNPPKLVMQLGLAGTLNLRLWWYNHTDAAATVDASGYFTNGYDLGMRDGDQCIVYNSSTKITTWHVVTVSGTTVNLADGTVIGSATNSD